MFSIAAFSGAIGVPIPIPVRCISAGRKCVSESSGLMEPTTLADLFKDAVQITKSALEA